jgi:hypothetical protein
VARKSVAIAKDFMVGRGERIDPLWCCIDLEKMICGVDRVLYEGVKEVR